MEFLSFKKIIFFLCPSWVCYTVATTVYLLNRCPKKSMNNRVPQEAWIGLKHSVVHLKFIGCVSYAHVPDELRKKFDNKGQKFIFVGYSEHTKGYKLYDQITRKFIINRDVQFMENEAWNGSITKTLKIIDAMEHDDTEDEMVQTPCTGQCVVPLHLEMRRKSQCIILH
jgi:hypothetical protein